VQAQLSDAEKAAYSALMRVVFAVPRVVTADIVTEGGLSLSDHLALQNLADAPDCQIRMTDLAFSCGVSQSGITRIVNRLAQAGLVTRVQTRVDARGAMAVLTEDGAARLKQVHAAHLASVRRHIFECLGDLDLAAFTSGMESIADSVLSAADRHRIREDEGRLNSQPENP
jgi:DNA-binding MarR family transcriptional regulator